MRALRLLIVITMTTVTFFDQLPFTLCRRTRASSASGYILPTPEKCSCGSPITKTIVQPVNMTIMVPEFITFTKTFSELKEVPLPVPSFYEEREEIRQAQFVNETTVETFTVQYDWQEVKSRVPVLNNTRVVIEDFQLIPTQQINLTVELHSQTYVDTKIMYVDEPYEEIQIVPIVKNITKEVIIYNDTIQYVDETILVNQTEYIEEYEYVPTEIYVWRIELYDSVLYQKRIKSGGGITKTVEIDDITIRTEKVPLPQISFTPRPVIVHEPVTISREPVPVPQFVNQTVKVAEKIMRKFPMPRFIDTPVQIPTYTNQRCSMRKNETQDGFLPSSCSCKVCTPCVAKCPPKNPTPTTIEVADDGSDLFSRRIERRIKSKKRTSRQS